jgi:hypothetical protein
LASSATGWIIYQPLIVGLGAVVLATFGNTLLEWFRQSLSNRHAAASLRRGLTEELRFSLETARANKKRADQPEKGGSFLIPLQEAYPLYDNNVSALGLLRPAEIAAAVNAYATLKSQIEVFAVMGRLQRIEGATLQAILDASWGPILSQQVDGLIETLDQAVQTLEGAEGFQKKFPRVRH